MDWVPIGARLLVYTESRSFWPCGPPKDVCNGHRGIFSWGSTGHTVNLNPWTRAGLQNVYTLFFTPRVLFRGVVLMHGDTVTFTIMPANLARWFRTIGHNQFPPPEKVPVTLTAVMVECLSVMPFSVTDKITDLTDNRYIRFW